MITNKVLLPLIAIALFFLYLAWEKDESYSLWIIPFLLAAALIYILKPEIDWWWHSKRPPKLPEGIRTLLGRFCAFYQGLDAAGRQRFEDRVALFRMGTDWTPMGFPDDEMPGDVEAALAAQAVMLTWNKEVFLFEKFEKVIVYPLPFPSYDHQYPHASELHEEDGCLLFSAQQVIEAFLKPSQFYQVGLHEYAKAYVLTYPQAPWPTLTLDEETWARLAQVSGMTQVHVEMMTGIAVSDPLPVAIHHYFTFPEALRRELPAVAETLDLIFDGFGPLTLPLRL